MIGKKYNYIGADSMISVVVTLVILSFGVFAFFVTIQSVVPTMTQNETGLQNFSKFNITDFFEAYEPIANIIPMLLIFAGITGVVWFTYRIAGSWELSHSSDDEEEEDEDKSPTFEDVKEMILHKEKLTKPTDLKTKLALRKQQLKEQQKQIEESKTKK